MWAVPMDRTLDYVIIGGGPAGIQMAYYLQRNGRSYAVLESSDRPGVFFETYPRHRQLLSINKVHTGCEDPELNLRHDWNSLLSEEYEPLFKSVSSDFFPSADALLTHLEAFVQRHGIPIDYGRTVTRVSRAGDGFTVECADGQHYGCRSLIVGTGVSQPHVPDIPGIDLAEGYEDFPLDPAGFTGKRVLIIGKGNSAFETADGMNDTTALIHLVSPNSIELAWETHYVGDLRAVNNNLLDTYQLKTQNAVLDADVRRIAQRDDGRFVVTFAYSHAGGEVEDRVYDRVIRCTGFRFDASFFDESCTLALTIDDRFPLLTSEWESANQPGIYFVGTITQSLDYGKTNSAFIHGFRYNVRVLSRFLEAKNHGEELRAEALSFEPDAIADRLLERVNSASELWQQQSFLTDVVLLDGPRSPAILCGMPVNYVRERFLDPGHHCLVSSLEFGSSAGRAPFSAARSPGHDVSRASESHFLHPVIREFREGMCLSEHHVMEDLEAHWGDGVHRVALVDYLEQRVGLDALAREAAG